MSTRAKTMMVLATIMFGLLQVTAAAGAVDLRFSPQDGTVNLNQFGNLSILLDEAIEVRTIEVTVTFDDSVLTGLEGGQGAAFRDLPCEIFEDFIPGDNQWYGFAVSIGVDCFVVGPGELFVWNFTGSNYGTSDITAVSVVMYDRYGGLIPDVNLPATTLVVGDGVVPVGDFAGAQVPTITASPNPCNPMTYIKFWLPEPREANLALFDLRGKRVRQLLAGSVPGEWTSVRWDGRTDSGVEAPSGVYLYRLETNRENLTGRVTLAR